MDSDTQNSSKLPWVKFSFDDWSSDLQLMCCSLAAQGLWMRMIAIMHHGKPYGHLSINGQSIGVKELTRLVRQTSPALIKKCLAELEHYGVYSKDSNGIIYCRRMVRDEADRHLQRASGSRGGNPNLVENYQKPGHIYAIRRQSDGAIKIGIAMNPTQRLYKIRQKSHGDKMELVMTWPVDNMGQSEKMIHELFANKRLQGEWFTLKGEDLYTMNSTLKGKNDLPLSLEVDVRENGLQPKPSSSNTAVEHQTAREEDDTALLAQESQKRETAPVEGPPDPLREFKAWVEPMVPGWARGKARKAWREPDDQEALRQIFVVRALHEIQACWELFITPGTKSYDHAVGQRFAMREFQRQMEYLITDEKYPTLKRRYLDRMAAGAPG